MREEGEQSEVPSVEALSKEMAADHSRRNLLRLGALGGVAVITVRPGIAQAAASTLKCTIPVPDANNATKWIKPDGSLVKANTNNAFAGPTSPLNAVDIQNAINYSTSYPGYSANASSAYTAYIKKLTQGTQGFTCYASIINPR